MRLPQGIQALSITRQFVQVHYLHVCLLVSNRIRLDFLPWWVDFAVLTLETGKQTRENKHFGSHVAVLIFTHLPHMGFRIGIYWLPIVGFPLKQNCLHIGMRMFVGFSGPGQ